MIQTFYKIGKAIQDDPVYEDYFQPWGNPFPGREDKAKVIIIEIENGRFKKASVEAFRKKYLAKYLYKPGSTKGRATNSVPTIPFIDIDKSFGKVEQSFKNFNHRFIDEEHLQSIKSALSELELDKKTSYLLTFKINGKYLGEDPQLVNLFVENAYRGFFEKNYSGVKNSSADNYICALSGKKSKVYGFIDSLGFTVNDDAFMRNGFDQSHSYKMFPVSQEAAKIVDGTKSLVFTNDFSNNFSGKIKYLILPKFIGQHRDDIIKEIFGLFKEKSAFQITTEEFKKGTGGFIKETENLISEIIKDEKLNQNDLLYDVLFYEDKQSQLSLLLQVSDIRPSRFKFIMDTKRALEKFYAALTNYDDGKKYYTFSINLATIKNFLITEQGKNKIPHPFFFKLTEAIFYGQHVDQQTFLRLLLFRFRKVFKELHENPYTLQTVVKEGFVIFQFLGHLNIFKNIQNSNIMEQNEQFAKLDSLGFIEQHPDFFNVNYKKGAFIFGCLTARLLYKQPGNAFLKQLNDLNIDKKHLERKFPVLINKLRQYEMEFRELEQAAARYMIDQTKMSKDDISFAVTLGLILQKEFDIKNKKIKEAETESAVKNEIVEP